MGVNVSKPLTALHGRPLRLTSSWRFRAVMSTARAGGGVRQHTRARRAAGKRTVACNVCVRVRRRNVAAGLADDEAKFD